MVTPKTFVFLLSFISMLNFGYSHLIHNHSLCDQHEEYYCKYIDSCISRNEICFPHRRYSIHSLFW